MSPNGCQTAHFNQSSFPKNVRFLGVDPAAHSSFNAVTAGHRSGQNLHSPLAASSRHHHRFSICWCLAALARGDGTSPHIAFVGWSVSSTLSAFLGFFGVFYFQLSSTARERDETQGKKTKLNLFFGSFQGTAASGSTWKINLHSTWTTGNLFFCGFLVSCGWMDGGRNFFPSKREDRKIRQDPLVRSLCVECSIYTRPMFCYDHDEKKSKGDAVYCSGLRE